MSRDAKVGPTRPASVPRVEPDDRAPIGWRVKGRYRIVSELGAGALGTVYLAEDEATGHGVAVRFLPRGLAGPSRAAQPIKPMGRSIVAASTADPALVRVLELAEAENGQAFVAVELVEGRRLSEILPEGPLALEAALRLALHLGAAVETLHNTGFVHGALRPRNVMVLEDGRVKLMDVELSGLRDARAAKGVIPAEPPPEYLSPEQILGDPATEKTDVYAFAVILYEMLCGAPPFQAGTRGAVLAKHLTEAAAPLRRRRPAVPESVESVIALALDKQPELRPLMEIVLNCLWTKAKRPATRWKRIAVIVGGAALAASIAVLVAWDPVAPRPSGPPPLAQPAPPAAEQAPVSAPPTSSARSLETSTPSTLGTTGPAVAPSAAARATSPSAPPPASPRSRSKRQEQARALQAPADRAREQPAASSDAEAYDPGAVSNWLFKSSSSSGD